MTLNTREQIAEKELKIKIRAEYPLYISIRLHETKNGKYLFLPTEQWYWVANDGGNHVFKLIEGVGMEESK